MSGVTAWGNRSPRYTGPVVGSVLLHAAVIAALVWHVDWGGEEETPVAANIIDAEVIDSGMLEKIEKAKEQEAAERAEQLRESRLAEQRAAEQAAVAERERREAIRLAGEQQKRDEQARLEQQRLAEQQRLEEQKRLEQQRLAEEQRRREEQARLEAERERERRRQEMATEEQRLSEQAQRDEWERLQAEERRAAEQARARELAGDKALYIQAIRQRVQRNWIRPISAEDGYTCEVVVHQIPGGDIVNVEFGACDGDAVFQRSVRNAVYKSAPLPDPPDRALFERRLVFEFKVKSE